MLFCPIVALSFLENAAVKLAIVLVFLLLGAVLTSGIFTRANNAGLALLVGYVTTLFFNYSPSLRTNFVIGMVGSWFSSSGSKRAVLLRFGRVLPFRIIGCSRLTSHMDSYIQICVGVFHIVFSNKPITI